MDPKVNVAQLCNVPLVLKDMLLHVMLSFNMNLLKYASLVNSNDLVLLKLVHHPMLNNMVAVFSMLAHFFHKLVLLVLSKISQLQVAVVLSVTVAQPMVKMLAVGEEPAAAPAGVVVMLDLAEVLASAEVQTLVETMVVVLVEDLVVVQTLVVALVEDLVVVQTLVVVLVEDGVVVPTLVLVLVEDGVVVVVPTLVLVLVEDVVVQEVPTKK